MQIKFIITVICLLLSTSITAQSDRLIKVTVVPNSADWNLKPGEKAEFDVSVTKSNIPLTNIEIRYELSHDMMKPKKVEKVTLKDGKFRIDAGTMKTSGFLRCRVFVQYDGSDYEGRATIGFAPESLESTTIMPDDFRSYWDGAIATNRNIPLASILKLLPDRCTSKVDVYEVGIQNYRYESYIYGILCVPKAAGKYPAVLNLPGAGIRPYNGDISTAEKGIITLEIGIHGIPVTLDRSVYKALERGPLNQYFSENWDNRDEIYFKRVYLGCVKCIDYIFSLDKFDGENIVVQGGSQGGALSIVTAALDNRVKGLVAFYPALCELSGFTRDTAGGWPHIFGNLNDVACVLEQKIKTSQYYDVTNFARLLKVPGFYSFGYNDMVCPPTSTYAAYNVIEAPKNLFVIPEIAHYSYPEQWIKSFAWIKKALKME